MKYLRSFYMILILLGVVSNVNAAWVDNADARQAWVDCNGQARIFLDSDGNQHDTDDWAATAATIAIIANRGDQDKIVGYTYSNHIWDENETASTNMDKSAVGTAEKFGIDPVAQNFIDAYDHPEDSYNAIRDAVNASSADNLLFMILAGPMEVAWQGINKSDPDKRQYVYCISHSSWNDGHAAWDHDGHDWNNIGDLGCNMDHIVDQNGDRFNTHDGGNEMADWEFLKTIGEDIGNNAAYEYVYDRIDAAYTSGDASDCGMTYYLYTGDEDGTTVKLEALMRTTTDGPKVNITSPENNAVVEEGTSINITASASDDNGTIKQVEFFDNGKSIGIANSAPYATTINNPIVGTHTFSAIATDNDNNNGQSTITVRISGCIGPNVKIEAEHFDAMEGFQVESCSDSDAGQNVGFTDVGDWLEYCVNIPTDGLYSLDMRVASPSTSGKADILLDGTTKTTINIPETGGWQDWNTIKTNEFQAVAGKQTLRINITGGGFNTNWIMLNSLGDDPITPLLTENKNNISVHFNPFDLKIIVDLGSNHNYNTISLIDMQGRTYASKTINHNKSEITLNSLNSEMKQGIYFLRLSGQSNSKTIKVLNTK